MPKNHFEIERKFLIFGNYKSYAKAKMHIVQGYLCSAKGRTVRVRLQDDKAFLTIKGPSDDGGLSRYEFEKEITPSEAQALMRLCEPGIIEKTRWVIPCCGHNFEVDEFHGPLKGLEICEVELERPDEIFEKPNFLGKEVTGNRKYYNSALRRRIAEAQNNPPT